MLDFFFDLETITDQRPGALQEHIAMVRPPGQYKKPESIAKWMEENAEVEGVESWKKTGLDGLTGEIISISWAFGHDAVEGLVRSPDDAEEVLLEGFFHAMGQKIRYGEGEHSLFQWIGHNVLGFDLPFLWKRCVILGIKPPCTIPKESRHGKGRVYDTMVGWMGSYPRQYIKQDTLVAAMGIETEADDTVADMDGSMVWDMVQAGRLDEVLKYNKLDVEKVIQMYRRMTWTT